VASALCDALERLAAGRGAKILTVDASDNAAEFFAKRGYVAMQRNNRVRRRRMAGQYHDAENAGRWRQARGSDMTRSERTRERLYLFDTTLRDGAQTNGVDFTLHDKQLIAEMLDELGIDYVEGGYPGANPTDTEFFAVKPKLGHARFTAFGMTRRPGRSAVQTIQALLRCWKPRRTQSVLSRNRRPTRCGSRLRPPTRKISPRSATA